MLTILLALQLALPSTSTSLVRCIGLDVRTGQPFGCEVEASPLVAAVEAVPAVPETRSAPWWATAISVALPVADGLSTFYALQQPGTAEGNRFFHHLFGSNVRPAEILGFKVAQGAVMGLSTHYGWRNRDRRAGIVFSMVVSGIVHGRVTAKNLDNAALARRLNGR